MSFTSNRVRRWTHCVRGKEGDAQFFFAGGGSILLTELKMAWHPQDVFLFPSHGVTHASAISLVATVGALCSSSASTKGTPPHSGHACQTCDSSQYTKMCPLPKLHQAAAVGDCGSLKLEWKPRAEPRAPRRWAPEVICSG